MKFRRLAMLVPVLFLLLMAAFLPGCADTDPFPGEPPSPEPTSAENKDDGALEELRGIWVSYMEMNTLLNGQSPDGAKAALDALMEDCASRNLNAVMLHVRANSDAYYPSSFFPAANAAAPLLEQGFDPLAYAVEAAHSRGLALHVWLNPYRIGTDPSRGRCDDVFQYDGRYYYIPSSLEAQKLILDGVREIVSRYAVDGVQYDDYFYPVGGVPADKPAEFEEESFSQSGMKDIVQWRQTHVNALMRATWAVVHRREGCVFGISPAADIEHDVTRLYADVREWMAADGYVDYICPQIYYGFENGATPFDKTLEQWLSLPRAASVKVHVGLALYKAALPDDPYAGTGRQEWSQNDDILKRAAELTRASGCGMILFSYSYFDPAGRGELSGDALAAAQREVENLLSVFRSDGAEGTAANET
ncbi:MAG: family 10 glycosylhydrolase [Clostridiales bacterium]|nr:family 10 glycosylhydrolase [Clostridiales bacterium]